MNPFLQLDDVLVPPPLAGVVSITITLALLGLGDALAIRLRGRDFVRAIDTAGGFIVAMGLIHAVVHSLALIGFASVFLLRSITLIITAMGLWHFRHWLRRAWAPSRNAAITLWRTADLLQRWALICIVTLITGLALASLGPATEVDSLDYSEPNPFRSNRDRMPRVDYGGSKPKTFRAPCSGNYDRSGIACATRGQSGLIHAALVFGCIAFAVGCKFNFCFPEVCFLPAHC